MTKKEITRKGITESYEKLIKSLKSCPRDENCRECGDFSECIHFIRGSLVMVLTFIRDLLNREEEIMPKGAEKIIDKVESQKDKKFTYFK